MNNTITSKIILGVNRKMAKSSREVTNMAQAKINREYIIKEIKTNDEELKNFLFTLGCYKGETVTLISILSESYVISVKDARYSIDRDLAEAIMI